MINYILIYFFFFVSIRTCHSEDPTPCTTSCSDDACLTVASSTTYRQILHDEIRFLKILLQRLTSAGLTSIKPEHMYRTLQLASSPEVETGTLEFTRQHLLNAILENTAARNELEYEYVSRLDGFSRIVADVRNRIQRFQDKVRGMKGNGTNWDVLVKIFDQCKKDEAVNEYMMTWNNWPLIFLSMLMLLAKYTSSFNQQYDEVWMSKKGATYDLTVPVSNPDNSGTGPFRQDQRTRMRLRSNGCTCQSLICGCCMDLNIAQFNFQRTGCMNLTVDPREFAIRFSMLWEDEPLYENTLSGKNPPPVCVPLPVPYIPALDGCMKVFDISVLSDKQRVHACLDMDLRIQRAPVLVLHFDCMQVGADASVSLVKPTASSGAEGFEDKDFP